ncbi:MAG: sulfatase [Geodermatophilaceae bacterium]|nr:sulfatase [Geodermatophilaceae bacterium]
MTRLHIRDSRARAALRLLALSALVATSVALPSAPAAAAGPPNVVVVLIDDARMDDVDTMPLTRSLIGDAGATFENSYAPFPLCCPSRATLLTGQYAHNHGVLDNVAPLGGFAAFDDSQTLATWLDEDYATGYVGKYLNEYQPARYVPPGWDTWKAALAPIHYLDTDVSVNGKIRSFEGQYRTNVMANMAVQFIRTETADPSEPFFLFTSFDAPHSGRPVEPDDPNKIYDTQEFPTPGVLGKYRDRFDDLPLDVGPAFNEADVSDKPVQLAPLEPWEIDALTEVNQQRREALLSVDDAVRRMVDELARAGELDNTYLIFTSDNGYMLGEHRFRTGKNLPYEPSVAVPLLIRGPGIAPGTVVPQTVGGHDVAPTVLGMTGLSGASGDFVIDGLDLLPLIDDPALHARRPVVLEVGPNPTAPEGPYRFHAIRTPEWKYVERSTGRTELYDVAGDPYELENLSRAPEYDQIRADLAVLLKEYRFCAGSDCW